MSQSTIRAHGLLPSARIVVAENSPSWPDLAERIEAIWRDEKSRRGDRLFDGTLFTLDSFDESEIRLAASSYKPFLAQVIDPSLRESGLVLRPLGVTGILTCPHGILFGRRAAHVTQNAGKWEPAPAGTLDCPDPFDTLSRELEEELGLAEKPELSLCGLVEDGESNVWDIIIKATLSRPFDAIAQARRDRGSDEYSDLRAIPPQHLADILNAERADFITATPAMLALAGVPVG